MTDRGGRPVLAVKASARSQVRGIVHDASSSGQTLFVEPLSVVEIGNRLAEVLSAEREEVERILAELSALVGARAGELVALVEATAALDLTLACGLLSRRWRGTPVEVADEVRLLGVRHPLLAQETAVPIDLDLGGLRALVVSGPNTGGKTVALKTLGLAAVLHQSGLRPPADRAVLPVFDTVLADIGDQQSIQMSLSTFSGHLGNIVRILGAAGARSLVLLDELAAGTDPAEGAALAQALLARLSEQARLTLVTTHYAELKEWASATAGAANAATAYDVETDTPLYRVALGRPGTSHALRVAERLGLDSDVVADARERVVPALLRAAELLAEAERAERTAGEERLASEQAREDAERLLEQAEGRRAALEAEIERVRASVEAERASARAGAEEELREARAALESLRAEIRTARQQERVRRRAQPGAARAAERRRDRRLGAAVDEAGRVEQSLRALDEPLPVLAPLAPGDPVEARELGVHGLITAIEGDEAEVLVSGGLRVRLPLARLRPDASPGGGGRAGAAGEGGRERAKRRLRPARRARHARRRGPRGGPCLRRRRGARGLPRGHHRPRARHRRAAVGSARRARCAPARRTPRDGLRGRRDGCLAGLIRTKAILESESSNLGGNTMRTTLAIVATTALVVVAVLASRGSGRRRPRRLRPRSRPTSCYFRPRRRRGRWCSTATSRS